MADFRTDRTAIVHHLSAALRFVDAFTAKPVGVPLRVQADVLPIVAGMPNTPWKALPGLNDSTYRLFVTNATVAPVGSIAISVAAPGNEYVNHEPFSVSLPRPVVAHPPTPDRSDFLVERNLWPTRVLRLPPGETAIVGTVRSGGGNTPVAGLRIRIGPAASPMPAAPYAYTDPSGGFVFRLPGLKKVSQGVVVPTASLDLDIGEPPLYAPVTPTAPVLPFTVHLGQVTVLDISVP